jgi:hypothetical protein
MSAVLVIEEKPAPGGNFLHTSGFSCWRALHHGAGGEDPVVCPNKHDE